MGWDFHHEQAPYDRKKICRSHVSDSYEVIKDAVVGTTWYAAVRNKETGKVHATIVLTQIDRSGYCNFGMKWMDETYGPFAYDCPKSILDLLSPTCDCEAMDWRNRCRAKALEKKGGGLDALRLAPIGAKLEVTTKEGRAYTVTKMAPDGQFKTYWLLMADNCHYLPKSRVKTAKVA